MRFFAWCWRALLIAVLLAAVAVPDVSYAQDVPKIAVYVFGSEAPAMNKAMVSRLITALSNSGRYQASENYTEFFDSAAEERQKNGAAAVKTDRLKTLGKQFGSDYICVAEITDVLGEKQVSAYILSVETGKITATGVADAPIKTAADLTAASEQIVATMFKSAPPPSPAPSATPSSSAAAPVDAASVFGDAKVAADRVVTAVNAFKDATNKSIAAADAVKAATQSKNFSAIRDAKKNVEDATAAVKKAKADVTEAIEALKTVGPEAEAAVKALGIDLAMFAGSADDGAAGGKGGGGAMDANKAQEKRNRRPHIGVNGFYSNSVGDNIKWKESGEVLLMPYSYGGAYIYFEWMARTANRVNSEMHLGYAGGGGKWESAAASNPRELPDVGRSILIFGASAKWPFSVREDIRLFPMFDTEMEIALNVRMNGKKYMLDDNVAFRTFKGWLYLGGGVDCDLSESVYLRVEMLYGYSLSLDGAMFATASHLSSKDANTDAFSRGLALKAGIGFKL